MLPLSLVQPLRDQLTYAKSRYEEDRLYRRNGVMSPNVLERKYPAAGTQWGGYWTFPGLAATWSFTIIGAHIVRLTARLRMRSTSATSQCHKRHRWQPFFREAPLSSSLLSNQAGPPLTNHCLAETFINVINGVRCVFNTC